MDPKIVLENTLKDLRSMSMDKLNDSQKRYLLLTTLDHPMTEDDKEFIKAFEDEVLKNFSIIENMVSDDVVKEDVVEKTIDDSNDENVDDLVSKLLSEEDDNEGTYSQLEENNVRQDIKENQDSKTPEENSEDVAITNETNYENSGEKMKEEQDVVIPDEESKNDDDKQYQDITGTTIENTSDLAEDNSDGELSQSEQDDRDNKPKEKTPINVEVTDGRIEKESSEKMTDEKSEEIDKYIEEFEKNSDDSDENTEINEYYEQYKELKNLPQQLEDTRKDLEVKERIVVDGNNTENDNPIGDPVLIEKHRKRDEYMKKVAEYQNKRNTYLDEKLEKDSKYKDFISYNNKYHNSLKKSNLDIDTIKKFEPINYTEPTNAKEIIAFTENLERTTDQGVQTSVVLPLSGIVCTFECLKPNSVLSMLEKLKEYLDVVDYDADEGEEDPFTNIDKSRRLLDRRKVEFETIYFHLHSLRDREGRTYRPDTLQEFLSLIKLSDMDQLFFGIFDATYRDKNRYDCECKNQVPVKYVDSDGIERETTKFCDNKFSYWAKNTSICLLRNEIISRDEMKMLKDGIGGPDFVKNLKVIKAADSEKEILTSNKFVLKLKIPTIQDYLETMECLLYTMDRGVSSNFDDYDLNLFDVSYDTIDKLDDRIVITKYYLLKMILFTNTIFKPVYADNNDVSDGKLALHYNKISKRKDIIETYNILGMEIFKLCRDKGLKSLIKLNAVKHFLTGIKCEECGNDIDPLYVNFESLFFSTGTESLGF